jgi:hypothetical protein
VIGRFRLWLAGKIAGPHTIIWHANIVLGGDDYGIRVEPGQHALIAYSNIVGPESKT